MSLINRIKKLENKFNENYTAPVFLSASVKQDNVLIKKYGEDIILLRAPAIMMEPDYK